MDREDLKYWHQMQAHNLNDCPTDDCFESRRLAYHLLHDPIDPNKDFKPALIFDPSREIPIEKRCIAFGLSMFESLEGLGIFWNSKNLRPEVKRSIGNMVNQIEIYESDGLVSPSRTKDSHFTFFENRLFEHEGKYFFVKELDL